MSAGALLLLGLLFGMQHATEADHLAAVATQIVLTVLAESIDEERSGTSQASWRAS